MDGLLGFVSVPLDVSPGGLSGGVIHLCYLVQEFCYVRFSLQIFIEHVYM